MRIAVATHTLARIGGVETYVEQSVRRLIERGHDVRVFCRGAAGETGRRAARACMAVARRRGTRPGRCRARVRRRRRAHARPRQSGDRAVPCRHATRLCSLPTLTTAPASRARRRTAFPWCARASERSGAGASCATTRGAAEASVPVTMVRAVSQAAEAPRGRAAARLGVRDFGSHRAMSTRGMACRRLAYACCRRPCHQPHRRSGDGIADPNHVVYIGRLETVEGARRRG